MQVGIPAAKITIMNTGFNARFNTSLMAKQASDVWYKKVVRTFPSKGESEIHAWETLVPQLREWIGARQFNNVRARALTVMNRKFEGSLEVPVDKVADDLYGVFATPKIDRLAESAAKWVDQIVTPIFLYGEAGSYTTSDGIVVSTVTYDGESLFSANHPIDPDDISKGVQSNYYASGCALTPDNFERVEADFMSLKGENGLPLNLIPDTLICGPKLLKKARRVLESRLVLGANGSAGSEDNVNAGSASILMIPELAGLANTGTWFLAKLKSDIDRAIVFQDRQAPEFAEQTLPTSDGVFLNDMYRYGVKVRGATFGCIWQTLFKCNP
jgi:phage major head subunit gpT-like protein